MTAVGEPSKGPFRVVGVVHLAPLPGSARGASSRAIASLMDDALADAAAYVEGGVDALMVENFGDVPFSAGTVGPHVAAAMAIVVDRVRRATSLPIGVNVLRNDVLGAVAVAAMAGGRFVRANVYVGAAVTDQGIIQGRADEVQAAIRSLDAAVEVWADLDVKHAEPLGRRPIAESAEDAVARGLAGAVIVTGRSTGQPVSLADLGSVREAVPETALYVGSGATPERVGELLSVADGVIVGTAAKRAGVVTNPVEVGRVRRLVEAARAASNAEGRNGVDGSG